MRPTKERRLSVYIDAAASEAVRRICTVGEAEWEKLRDGSLYMTRHDIFLSGFLAGAVAILDGKHRPPEKPWIVTQWAPKLWRWLNTRVMGVPRLWWGVTLAMQTILAIGLVAILVAIWVGLDVGIPN